jgi:hypothetical protein
MNFNDWSKSNPGKSLNDFYAWKLKNEPEAIESNKIHSTAPDRKESNETLSFPNDFVKIIYEQRKTLIVIALISTFLPAFNDSAMSNSQGANNLWGRCIYVLYNLDRFSHIISFKGILMLLSPLFLMISFIITFLKVFNVSNFYDTFPKLSAIIFFIGTFPYLILITQSSFSFFLEIHASGTYLSLISIGLLSFVNLSRN